MAGNTLLFSEILDKVHKAKTKDQKVRILRENNTAALRSILKSSFDPKIQWVMPPGDVPYAKNEAPAGTEHTSLAHEARKLFHFIEGGNANLKQNQRETMFIRLLESLHPSEADIVIAAKDKILHQKYKGLSKNVVMEAFDWNDDFMVVGDSYQAIPRQ